MGEQEQKKQQESDPVMENVLRDVAVERKRQDEKWGVQNHPHVHPSVGTFETADPFALATIHGIPTEEVAKMLCKGAAASGDCSWLSILVEELSEAAVEAQQHAARCNVVTSDPEGLRKGLRITRDRLRKELVQVAAVAVQWIEALDTETWPPVSDEEVSRG